MRSATTDSKTPYNYARTSTPKAAWSHRYNAAKKNGKPTAAAPAAHEVPFIAACSHCTRKNNKVSCSDFLPKHISKPMQHSCSHYNTFRSITLQTCTYLHTWQHQMTTIMQPFQCDLQPQIPKHPIIAHTQAQPKQLEATVTMRQEKKGKPTAAAPTAHRRYLSSPPAATLHGKIQGFVLRLPPQNKFQSPGNIHAAITICFAASRRKPARLYTHGNTRWQQSCGHSNAICNHRFKKRIELRTQEQPLVAKHIEETTSRQKRHQPHPLHTRGTFHRRLQPLYTEKYKVSCSGFLPKTKPRQHPCSHYITFRSIPYWTCISLHAWQHQMTTIKQPFQCDQQQQIQETQGTTHTDTTTGCRTQRRTKCVRSDRSRTRRTHEVYLSSPAATTLHGKTPPGFVLRLPPQHIAHATFMQPFQCDLPPQLQEPHRTTHTGTITRCKTHRRNHFATETTPAAPAAHTRHLSSPAATTLHGKMHKNTRFRAPASSPTHSPCNIHAAIPMRSATTASRNA